jgi:hypothetical protein
MYLITVLLSAPIDPLLAQNRPVPGNYTGDGETLGDRMGYPSNAPFAASWKATGTERGTAWTNSGKEARDSSGKTLIEVDSVRLNQVHMSGSATFDVLDLKNHTDLYWMASSKQATLTHFPKISDEKRALDTSWAGRVWSEPLAIAFDPVGGQY